MRFSTPLVAGLMAVSPAAAAPKSSHGDKELYKNIKPIKQLELGPRPYYLVNDMDEGSLKKKLQSCSEKPQKPSLWSIAHRGGATLQFPEHSLENNLAGARMGAGVLECDVAFTKDRELVCRHSQCDLHYTTNIVTIPELNKKCTQPFKAAKDGKPASAKCCTSDITLKEYKTLCAKMEGFNATATNAADFLKGTPGWRTDLYSTCGTVMTNKEHIQLTKRLGLKHTPELKTPEVKMPFDGDYTQEKYAQQLIDEHKEAGVKASDVYLQSFLYDDILYWLEAEPEYARQAMYLDSTGDSAETFPGAVANLTRYAKDGVKYIAPPLPYLVQPGKGGKMVPSPYAKKAKELGLKIVTWSLERSPPLKQAAANGDYYYSTIAKIVNNDGDVFKLLDVFREIGVVGVFSDWSATVTYYANCFGIGL